MIKLAPSILSSDFAILGNQIRTIENAGAHYVHLDVMDGNFVPNISFGAPVIKSIRKVTNMTFDVHLMIDRPERYIEDFVDAGADIVNFHIEATEKPRDTIKRIKQLNRRVGLTIKPNTDPESIFEYIEYIDLVLVMSVEPGFGGQSFIPESLKKAEKLAEFIQKNNYLTEIEMDGGITLSNVKDVINAGVNIVVAGSSVFNVDCVTEAVKAYYKEFNLLT